MRAYLLTLVWTMLFVVLVEMVFPVSDLKKYLKLVLSFIVIYVLVSPVLTFMQNGQMLSANNLEDYIHYYQFKLGDTSYEAAYEEQQESVMNIYKEQLGRQIKELIETKLPLEVTDVTAEVELTGAHFDLEELNVSLAHKKQVVGIGNKNESLVLDEAYLQNEIKNCINDFYNVDNTNIYITVQDN